MTGHTPWPVLKVRTMLRRGWEVWESPMRETLWARLSPNSRTIETREIAPDELEVVDTVLRQESGTTPQGEDDQW